MKDNTKPPFKIIRCPEVLRKTGLSRATIYRLMAKGFFPRCRPLASGAVGWSEEEVDTWIQARFSDL